MFTLGLVPTRSGDLGQRLPRIGRLRKRWEFLAVRAHGRRVGSPSLVVYCRRRSSSVPRLGITVSRRVSKKAVVRNQIKRWVREAFRRLRGDTAGYDLLVIARPRAAHATYDELYRELREVMRSRLRLR